MIPLSQKTKSKLKYFDMRKNCNMPKYIIVIFLGIFCLSIIFNIKLIFFPKSLSLMDIPFDAQITEASSNEIIVKGFGENLEYFRDNYRILRTDEMKIVNEDDQSISFDDLKPGMYVNVRVVNYDFDFTDMDAVVFVTKIKCSETKEGLYE